MGHLPLRVTGLPIEKSLRELILLAGPWSFSPQLVFLRGRRHALHEGYCHSTSLPSVTVSSCFFSKRLDLFFCSVLSQRVYTLPDPLPPSRYPPPGGVPSRERRRRSARPFPPSYFRFASPSGSSAPPSNLNAETDSHHTASLSRLRHLHEQIPMTFASPRRSTFLLGVGHDPYGSDHTPATRTLFGTYNSTHFFVKAALSPPPFLVQGKPQCLTHVFLCLLLSRPQRLREMGFLFTIVSPF